MSENIWSAAQILFDNADLVIDRPKGSQHPRYPQMIYPFDYGYLEGTRAGDCDGIDVWRGSLAGDQVTALVCTIDLNKKDAEVKILLGCTDSETDQILAFHNHGSQVASVILRPDDSI